MLRQSYSRVKSLIWPETGSLQELEVAFGYANNEERFRPIPLSRELERSLNDYERDLMRKCETAARIMAKVYSVQESPLPEENNFYPEGTREEDLRATARLPEKSDLTSPYAIVIKDRNREYFPIPYHIAYRRIFEQNRLLETLTELSQISVKLRDSNSSTYFRQKREEFTSGDHKSPEITRMKRLDEPKIELVIGFYDTNTDNFGIKYSAQAWGDVLDAKSTQEYRQFLEALKNWVKESTGRQPPDAKVRASYLFIVAGQAAKYDWVGNNLPCQPAWRQEMGSKIDIFVQRFDAKFARDWYPAFRDIISPNRRVGLSESQVKELAKTAFIKRYIAHEYGHSLVPEGLSDRFGGYADFLKELYCELFAIHSLNNMPTDSKFGNKEKDFVIASEFSEGIVDYQTYNSPQQRRAEYFVLSSVIKKYCEDKKSIFEENGCIAWKSYRDPRDATTALYFDVDHLIRYGNYDEVVKFFDENFDSNTYRSLATKQSAGGPFSGARRRPTRSNPNHYVA